MSPLLDLPRRIRRNWWASRSDTTRALPRILASTLRSFGRYSSRQSAALAFFALFSLFPLMLLLAVFIGGLLEPAAAQEQIANGLRVFLPEDEVIVEFVRDIFDESLEQSNSFGIVAIMTIVWSSLSLFSNLTASLDEIFRVPKGRNIWKLRLQAIGISLALVVLVIASFLTSGVLRLLSVFQLDQPSLWLSIGIRFLPYGLDVVIFGLLFRFVPARYVHWDAVLPAALLGAVGWELAKGGFGLYMNSVAGFQFVYGGIATVIVFLFWAFLIAAIFLFSAEFCAQLNEWIMTRQNPDAAPHPSVSIAIRDGQIQVRLPEPGVAGQIEARVNDGDRFDSPLL
ncbi:MAG: YihY/virulence factor BrkB family protein [Chloroflexi bacterium]|nr:YihY/virulence factor BrkB family protein [Chloroflexota bacterium]